MARTTFFTHGTRNEQFLLQNLEEEMLTQYETPPLDMIG